LLPLLSLLLLVPAFLLCILEVVQVALVGQALGSKVAGLELLRGSPLPLLGLVVIAAIGTNNSAMLIEVDLREDVLKVSGEASLGILLPFACGLGNPQLFAIFNEVTKSLLIKVRSISGTSRRI
jgi:hypothetical protein